MKWTAGQVIEIKQVYGKPGAFSPEVTLIEKQRDGSRGWEQWLVEDKGGAKRLRWITPESNLVNAAPAKGDLFDHQPARPPQVLAQDMRPTPSSKPTIRIPALHSNRFATSSSAAEMSALLEQLLEIIERLGTDVPKRVRHLLDLQRLELDASKVTPNGAA